MRKSIIAAAALLAAPAAATPVTYMISGGEFSQVEGSFSGRFTYDIDTNAYTDISVRLTGSSTADYNGEFDMLLTVEPFTNSEARFLKEANDVNLGVVIALTFTPSLNATSGVLSADLNECFSEDCDFGQFIGTTSGTFAAVPVPPALGLLAAAMAGLFVFRRAKS